MHIRDLVKQRWAEAGLYARKDARLQSFLKHIDDTPLECWEEYVALFRREYYDLFDELVPPLVHTGDRLLRVVLIRCADLKQPRELDALREFVRGADPLRDRAELNAILSVGREALRDEFLRRPELKDLVAPPKPPKKLVTNVVRARGQGARKPK